MHYTNFRQLAQALPFFIPKSDSSKACENDMTRGSAKVSV